ncbi:MAG: hypothetical protein Kow0092_37190 [Deferrisomatales bacterium]
MTRIGTIAPRVPLLPRRIGPALAAAALALLALGYPLEAAADHSLGRPCLSCHALRSAEVKAGTRNILKANVDPYALYTSQWYCSGSSFQGGQPLDCSYCHVTIATEFGRLSSHPVYVQGDSGAPPANRIYCNSCHSTDVTPRANDGAVRPSAFDPLSYACAKDPGAGYPNHNNLSAVVEDTGTNHRTGAAAHLRMGYGLGEQVGGDPAVDWKTNLDKILCFDCHNASQFPGSSLDVLSQYEAPNGGHNIVGRGSALDIKLPCYNCHDPHGSANLSLINDGSQAIPNPFQTSTFSVTGYDDPDPAQSPDGALCLTCHDGTATVHGVTPDNILSGWSADSPWHNGVHAGLDQTSNCLKNNGGCHQVHNTDLSRCQDCHYYADGSGDCDNCHGFPPVDGSLTPVARGNDPGPGPNGGASYSERVGTDPTGYADGGGVHRTHVNLIWKHFDPDFDPTSPGAVPTVPPDPVVLCGPCHGDDPGGKDNPNHIESSDGAVYQANIDIRPRSKNRNDDTDLGFFWGASTASKKAVYTEITGTWELRMYDTADPGGKAKAGGDQVCANLDCHGNPDPKLATDKRAHHPEVLRWIDTVDSAREHQYDQSGDSKYEVGKKTAVCKWCHDETPARVVLRYADGTKLYDNRDRDENGSVDDAPAPDVAAAYFAPPSGYSRGGHGDGNITAVDDPSFVDSATRSTATEENKVPVECEACHHDELADWAETGRVTSDSGVQHPNAMRHLPVVWDAGTEDELRLHRLDEADFNAVEDNSHSTSSVCGRCHDPAQYPGEHHPSYYGATGSNPTNHAIVPAGGQEVFSSPGTWTDQGGGHYAQDGYSASGCDGDADFFTDWWGGSPGSGNQDPPPAPSPLAVLPLEQYVFGPATSSSDRVMCVTCHNPHGTDLFTYDPSGGHEQIPDNNMLRLRDSDNTLCEACH